MIKRITALITASILLLSLSACASGDEEPIPDEYYTATFFAMDTEVTVKLANDTGLIDENEKKIYHDSEYLSSIVKECADIAAEKEKLFSRTDKDSVVSELNTEADYFLKINDETLSLIEYSNKLSDELDGKFDITIGSVTELWNVTGDKPTVPSDESIAEALSHVGRDKIITDGESVRKTDRLTKFDLGAVAKGYTLGKIIEYLKTTDVEYGLVSFGGNVGVFGEKPESGTFKVGVTNALDTSKVSGFVFIDDEYVSVSGDYERYFTDNGIKYSHIFDPATGRPADTDITSVAVICKNAADADALSTALFVMGSDEATALYGVRGDFEAVIQTKDGELILTDGLKSAGAFEVYVEPPVTEEE